MIMFSWITKIKLRTNGIWGHVRYNIRDGFSFHSIASIWPFQDFHDIFEDLTRCYIQSPTSKVNPSFLSIWSEYNDNTISHHPELRGDVRYDAVQKIEVHTPQHLRCTKQIANPRFRGTKENKFQLSPLCVHIGLISILYISKCIGT
jgi:hypothetical protein